MGVITALRADNKNKKLSVFIDGSFSFAVCMETAAVSHLVVGQQLSAQEINKLKQSDNFQRCLEAALTYLDYRPRSEFEVRQRLHRRGFSNEVIDKVVMSLREHRFVDDVAFAQYWADNRLSFKPRSKNLIKLELRQKGVTAETIDAAVENLDEENAAYEACYKKARFLTSSDYAEFRSRLSNYLRRRGFNYGIISSVVMRLWQERQNDSVQF